MATVTCLLFKYRCHIDIDYSLESVTPCDIVHDIEATVADTTTPEEEETATATTPEETTGKPCFIVYEDCLLELANMKVSRHFCSTIMKHKGVITGINNADLPSH